MIVVDTNVVISLLWPSDMSEAARAVLRRDAEWAAPILWRSELRNVLATLIRRGRCDLSDARLVHDAALQYLAGREYAVDSAAVLELAAASGRSAYDCEFVWLARELEVTLVTADRKIVSSFPQYAAAMTQ